MARTRSKSNTTTTSPPKSRSGRKRAISEASDRSAKKRSAKKHKGDGEGKADDAQGSESKGSRYVARFLLSFLPTDLLLQKNLGSTCSRRRSSSNHLPATQRVSRTLFFGSFTDVWSSHPSPTFLCPPGPPPPLNPPPTLPIWLDEPPWPSYPLDHAHRPIHHHPTSLNHPTTQWHPNDIRSG